VSTIVCEVILKILLKLLLVLFLLMTVAAAGVGAWLYSLGGKPPQFVLDWVEAKHRVKNPVEFDLKRGESLRAFSDHVFRLGLVNNPEYFYWWVRIYGSYGEFQAGHYQIADEVSPHLLADKISKGKVYTPIALQVTVPEGFTLPQIIERLASKGVGTIDELTALSADKEFLKELKIPSTSLEGYLYPLTYSFEKLPSAREAFASMSKAFWQSIPAAYEEQLKKHGLSLADAVKVASLIELETRFDEERSKVAEVILTRLKSGSALGIDAAIIYGISDYAGDLTFKHLRDASNPYNSRIHKGLPPTPIGAPSKASLEAVVNPSAEGWYYYVVDPENGGRHHFSRDAKEHGAYVRKLMKHERVQSNRSK
jgi:UPF0755 protein